MNRIMVQRQACLVAAIVFVGVMGEPALAEEFRVENKIYVGAEKEPRTESTTIFHEGLVYDYLQRPAEVTVFDKGRRRFVLLDPNRRVKTEISADEISALTKNLHDWAASQSDPYLQFLANPKLDEAFDEATGELRFTSPWLTYRVVMSDPQSETVVRQYREFSDWYTLLNTRINPGSRLPFARLIVNEALEKHSQLPKEVHLTMRAKRGLPFQKITVRSEHHFVRTLVQSDRDRIKQSDEFMGMFRPVDLQEYQKTGE
jgi:hypothetical protein